MPRVESQSSTGPDGSPSESANQLDSRVSNYIAALGAIDPCEPENFEAFHGILQERHGEKAKKFRAAMRRGNSKKNARGVFVAKNADLGLALDVAMGYSGGLYANQMQTVVEKFGSLGPKRVLDVGCDEGLLTCFYAMLWPDAEVVGRDLLPDGIALANELAQLRFGLGDRIRFEKSSIADTEQPDGKFDLVFASRALLAESIPTSRDVDSYSVTSPTGIDEDRAAVVVRNLLAKLNPEGCLFVLDRLSRPAEAANLAMIIEDCGGFVDWERSERLRAKELQDANQLMPALLVQLTEPSLKLEASAGALALFAESNQFDQHEFRDSAAEAVATALRREKLLFSARITDFSDYGPDGATTGSFEIWDCGSIVLEYQTWTIGVRRATLHSAHMARQVIERVRAGLEEQMYELAGEFDTEPVLEPSA